MALTLIATEQAQEAEIRFGFDAFRNHSQSQTVGQLDYSLNQLGIIRVNRRFMDEGTINLKHIEGQLSEITQRRVARAEVINSNLNTPSLQLTQGARGGVGVLHDATFSEFKFE